MSNGSTFVSTHCWANNVCQFDLSLSHLTYGNIHPRRKNLDTPPFPLKKLLLNFCQNKQNISRDYKSFSKELQILQEFIKIVFTDYGMNIFRSKNVKHFQNILTENIGWIPHMSVVRVLPFGKIGNLQQSVKGSRLNN